jgi:hypothetical protein
VLRVVVDRSVKGGVAVILSKIGWTFSRRIDEVESGID